MDRESETNTTVPILVEALQDVISKLRGLTEEQLDPVISQDIIQKLKEVIRSLEQPATVAQDSRRGQTPPAPSGQPTRQRPGRRRRGSGANSECEEQASQRTSLPPGGRRVYVQDRPGRTHREYESGPCEFSSSVERMRRSDIIASLDTKGYSEFICLRACPQEHIEQLQSIVKTIASSALPMDIQAAFVRIQKLLQLPKVLSNVSCHAIGSILHRLQEDMGAETRFDSATQICTHAESQKFESGVTLKDLCAQAGCTTCVGDQACEPTQKKIKLLSFDYKNFTPTFMEQAHQFAAECSPASVLATCVEPPSDVRKTLSKAMEMKQDIINSPLPIFSSGVEPVLYVVGPGVEAIQYCDGDGGLLVAEKIPGLAMYASKAGITCQQHIASHNYTFIPFREQWHDAIELGHCYEINTENTDGERCQNTKEFGYLALTRARRNISDADKIYIVPDGVDTGQQRLLVEIYCRIEAIVPKSNGVILIENGLSFPTIGAPTKYREALLSAQEAHRGVYEFGAEIGATPLFPWELKQSLQEAGSHVEVNFVREDGMAVSCTVRNRTDRLNESHLLIMKSLIPGAGLGLFLRPNPLTRRSITVPAGKMLCFYANGTEETNEESDYALKREIGGKIVIYDAKHYDGQNIGRFINQGGLIEGLKELVQSCDKDSGATAVRFGQVNKVMQEYTNVVYAARGYTELYVRSRMDIKLQTNPVELLATYGIEFWLLFTLRNYQNMEDDNIIRRCVLWTLLSERSAMEYNVKNNYLQGFTVPQDIVDKYKNMPCPYPKEHRSRRSR